MCTTEKEHLGPFQLRPQTPPFAKAQTFAVKKNGSRTRSKRRHMKNKTAEVQQVRFVSQRFLTFRLKPRRPDAGAVELSDSCNAPEDTKMPKAGVSRREKNPADVLC